MLQAILDSALPFFALIFRSCGAGPFRVLDEGGIAGVNAFVSDEWYAGRLDDLGRLVVGNAA